MPFKPTTYWDYLRLPELLDLQKGIAPSEAELGNDEVMFIVIHQIDELWFKLAIRELATTRDLFARDPVPEQSLASAARGLRRTARIFEMLAAHFALMETMTTRDYLAFRGKLTSASGFQSAQLREIEILLGLHGDDRLGGAAGYRAALLAPGGAPSWASRRFDARMQDRQSLRDAVLEWLWRTPLQGSHPNDPGDKEQVDTFIAEFTQSHEHEVRAMAAQALAEATQGVDREQLAARFDREITSARSFLRAEDVEDSQRAKVSRVRAALVFIESYRELPLLAWPREVLDAIVALEQASLVFRQRHARMVERVIGRRTGTGGSAGVEYLDRTALSYRVFDELWTVRTLLVQRQALPALRNAESYGFVGSHAD